LNWKMNEYIYGEAMEKSFYLAFDLGAESGRTILGQLENRRILIREISRFPNTPVEMQGHLHWDIYDLFENIKLGMRAGLAAAGRQPESLAVDTWGVDFGLLSPNGTVLGLPYAYRDARTQGLMELFFERVPRSQIYERTGIQFLPFNSLFQLFASIREEPGLIEKSDALLFMSDLFSYLLTGKKVSESTIASTSQLLNARSQTWDPLLLSALGAPPRLMQTIVSPGTELGLMKPSVIRETGLKETRVIATAGHDTAAAIVAVPAAEEGWAYISSGTWSLLGVELGSPLINPDVLGSNFTNEGGVAGTTRFLKNIAGLWFLQQCRREWSADRTLGYTELSGLAVEAPPFGALIDPDRPDFLNPPSMTEAIRGFCRRTGQTPPLSPPEIVRCILESLAMKYRWTLDELVRLTGKAVNRIHVIGGGSRNERLCQFTADATGLPVFAGPAEATAIGNIMVQALAAGQVSSVGEIRTIVRESVDVRAFEPVETSAWDQAYVRFRGIMEL
jgi:rhamnulokinase